MDPAHQGQKCFNLWFNEESKKVLCSRCTSRKGRPSLFLTHQISLFYVANFQIQIWNIYFEWNCREVSSSAVLQPSRSLSPLNIKHLPTFQLTAESHPTVEVGCVWGGEGPHPPVRHVASAPGIACQNTQKTPEPLSTRSNCCPYLPFFPLPPSFLPGTLCPTYYVDVEKQLGAANPF